MNTLLSMTPLAGMYFPGQTAEIVLWIFAILALVILAVSFSLDKWKDIWQSKKCKNIRNINTKVTGKCLLKGEK